MEATFLAKRALFNIPKFLPHGQPKRVTWACLSTAYERAEGSNVVAEGSSDASRDYFKGHMNENKHQAFATAEGSPPGSTTSFAADTAKAGIKTAVDMAEDVGDTAKETLDGAWRAAKDTAQGIRETVPDRDEGHDDQDEIEEDIAVDEIRKVDQLVDTQEYRSIEELKKLEDQNSSTLKTS